MVRARNAAFRVAGKTHPASHPHSHDGEGEGEHEEPLQLAVDVDRLCPPGMTAKHYGALYTTEFVQLCLDAANPAREVTRDVVRSHAAEVVGGLFYLILTAKTRGRREVMKRRKGVALEAYGACSHSLHDHLRPLESGD